MEKQSNFDDIDYTRCPRCGVRIPRFMMHRHEVERHGKNELDDLRKKVSPAFVIDGSNYNKKEGDNV